MKEDFMKKIFEKNGILISDLQEKQFRTYYELLVEWNDRINLTAITEYQEVLWKHFIDSALFLNTDIVKNTKVLPDMAKDMAEVKRNTKGLVR